MNRYGATARGDDPREEDYLGQVGRLNMAKLNTESQALREKALLDPEEEDEVPFGRGEQIVHIDFQRHVVSKWCVVARIAAGVSSR